MTSQPASGIIPLHGSAHKKDPAPVSRDEVKPRGTTPVHAIYACPRFFCNGKPRRNLSAIFAFSPGTPRRVQPSALRLSTIQPLSVRAYSLLLLFTACLLVLILTHKHGNCQVFFQSENVLALHIYPNSNI